MILLKFASVQKLVMSMHFVFLNVAGVVTGAFSITAERRETEESLSEDDEVELSDGRMTVLRKSRKASDDKGGVEVLRRTISLFFFFFCALKLERAKYSVTFCETKSFPFPHRGPN